MPRRSFVLLVLIMLAGLWTPPHATKAQTGCPEDGCKVYLPLVPTEGTIAIPILQRGSTKSGCDFYFYGDIENTTSHTLTNISAKHNHRIPTTIVIHQTTLAPGEATTWYVWIIQDAEHEPGCYYDPSSPSVKFQAWGYIHSQ